MEDGIGAGGEGRPPRSRRELAKKIIRGLISLAIVVGIFVGVMPAIANYSDVWATIEAMTWLELTTLLLFAIWNIVTYWFVLVAVLPGLRYAQAAVVNQASTAIANTLPGGGALGVGVTYAMYTSWGFTVGMITRSVIVSGVWNNLMKLGFPVVALALLAIQGDVAPALFAAAVIGVVVLIAVLVGLGLILKSDRLARAIGNGLAAIVSFFTRMLHRPPITTWGDSAVRFRTDTVDLLRHRWVWLTLATLVSHTSLYLVLLVALRHVGVSNDELSWITVLAAFAFVRLISALPVTPGGVGVVELGYAAALTIGMDDMMSAQVVAAVLVFRFFTYVLPIPFGSIAYVYWRFNKSWRREVPHAEEGSELVPELESERPQVGE